MIDIQYINQSILLLRENNNSLIPEIKPLMNKRKKPGNLFHKPRCFLHNFHEEENLNEILLMLSSLLKELDTSCHKIALGT